MFNKLLKFFGLVTEKAAAESASQMVYGAVSDVRNQMRSALTTLKLDVPSAISAAQLTADEAKVELATINDEIIQLQNKARAARLLINSTEDAVEFFS